MYNYPTGKGELGAYYLDVFQSTYDLLVHLSDAGYDIWMNKSDLPSVKELSEWIIYMGNKGTCLLYTSHLGKRAMPNLSWKSMMKGLLQKVDI